MFKYQAVNNNRRSTANFVLCGVFLLLTNSAFMAHSASNVPQISEQQLTPTYWQAKPASDSEVRMTNSQISDFNQNLFSTNPHMVKPLEMASVLDKNTLTKKIASISSTPESARFYADGSQLTPAHFQSFLDNTNLNNVQDSNKVHFGLVVKRAALRTFPTENRVFNQSMDLDLDRFQETAVFPGEAVAILHESADGLWFLVQNYNYLAWVKQDAIAIGDKQKILKFVDNQEFLLVTGAKVFTNYVPMQPQISQVQLDMGVKLPLVADEQQQVALYGQSTAATYQVTLPVRNDDGSLRFQTALIGRTQDVTKGFIPFTTENLIAQGFKFLGERYGWGHDYNGRDCTGFVGEIYKTFGILMPRNSGQQGQGDYGTNFRFDKSSDTSSKMTVLSQLHIGDLIYIPGHVMMYLGEENDQPIIIHDVKGLAYWTPDGEYYSGVLNAVSVTPLLTLQLNKKTTYVDRIYNIKRISLQNESGN